MRTGDHSYPGVQLEVWNVTQKKISPKLFSCDLFEITRNFCHAR